MLDLYEFFCYVGNSFFWLRNCFHFFSVDFSEVSFLCFCCSYVHVCMLNVHFVHLYFWFGNSSRQHFIFCKARRRHNSSRNERRGRIKQRSKLMARQDGKKMCIRSHCASNVITGSDSSMWHATLPICQSKIGRVTNGYHCHPPSLPPESVSFFEWRGRRVT